MGSTSRGRQSCDRGQAEGIPPRTNADCTLLSVLLCTMHDGIHADVFQWCRVVKVGIAKNVSATSLHEAITAVCVANAC